MTMTMLELVIMVGLLHSLSLQILLYKNGFRKLLTTWIIKLGIYLNGYRVLKYIYIYIYNIHFKTSVLKVVTMNNMKMLFLNF
jgi:hypothetical protein